MGIRVQSVKPTSGGFGEFDLGEAVEYDEFDTADEYVEQCCLEDDRSTDEETEAAAEDADGRIHHHGSGKVVAFRDQDGFIELWCVTEMGS